jgi:hypothetical protein
VLVGYKLLSYYLNGSFLAFLVFAPILLLLVINLVLRRKLKYKDWFIKHLGFLNEKVTSTFETEIPSSLIFDKLIEQIQTSKSKLYDSNLNTNQILAGNSIGIRTWGENIYIDINSSNTSKPVVTLTSVTVFGLISWNKNKENIEKFHHSFEESLTI